MQQEFIHTVHLLDSTKRINSRHMGKNQQKEYPQNRIREYRIAHNLTQGELGKKMKSRLSHDMVAKLERREREFTYAYMQEMASVFGCEPESLIITSEKRPETKVIGKVGAGSTVFLFNDYDADNEDVVPTPGGLNPEGLAAVRVEGNSQYPAYTDRALLFYYRRSSGIDPDAINQMAIGQTTDGMCFFKFLRPTNKQGHFDLISVNAPPIENVRIKWASKVRAVVFP